MTDCVGVARVTTDEIEDGKPLWSQTITSPSMTQDRTGNASTLRRRAGSGLKSSAERCGSAYAQARIVRSLELSGVICDSQTSLDLGRFRRPPFFHCMRRGKRD